MKMKTNQYIKPHRAVQSRRIALVISVISFPWVASAFSVSTRAAARDVVDTKLFTTTEEGRKQDVRFSRPLIEEGYPDAVEELLNGTLTEKPILLYLPGFDGTWMSPFLQFPELGTIFDLRSLVMSMKDRSTYEELKNTVIEYILQETQSTSDTDERTDDTPSKGGGGGGGGRILKIFKPGSSSARRIKRPIYLCGESFGGILASDVALTLLQQHKEMDMKGLVIVNAATCYDRSKLAAEGPSVALSNDWLYLFGLSRLLPLFSDEYSLDQLLMILRAQALPSVIDTAAREAYMGRVAFSLPSKLEFMPRGTLSWRLEEWLNKGCASMDLRLDQYSQLKAFRTLIVAGENDLCLPSIDEARRLSSIFANNQVHVVEGAGHGSTCGSRIDLAALMRNRFPELRRRRTDRTQMKSHAAKGEGVLLGMEPRYDGRNDKGLLPWLYWSRELYHRPPPEYRK